MHDVYEGDRNKGGKVHLETNLLAGWMEQKNIIKFWKALAAMELVLGCFAKSLQMEQ